MTETWNRVVALVTARDPSARCTDEGARTDWSDGNNAPVRIVMMPSEVAATPCVTIVAWVGDVSSLDPREALEVNGRLLEGAIMVRNGVYLFRVTVVCAQLDDVGIARWLDYAATNASALRARGQRDAIVRPDQFAWACD